MFSSNVSLVQLQIPSSPWPLNLHNFRLSRLTFDQFHSGKVSAPMINSMVVRSFCASYLLFVPGTTRNFPPGEAGGENVFSFVPTKRIAP